MEPNEQPSPAHRRIWGEKNVGTPRVLTDEEDAAHRAAMEPSPESEEAEE